MQAMWIYVVNDKYSDEVPVSLLKVSVRAFHYKGMFKQVVWPEFGTLVKIFIDSWLNMEGDNLFCLFKCPYIANIAYMSVPIQFNDVLICLIIVVENCCVECRALTETPEEEKETDDSSHHHLFLLLSI